MSSNQLIAVAGVTGNTGSAAAETVLEKGARLRVIVRSEEKGAPWKERGAEVAVTDLTDGDSIAAALSGADGAYLLSPPDLAAEDFLGNRKALVDAAAAGIAKSGVPHVAYLSSVGAQHADGTGVIRSAHSAEQTLGPLDASTTFIRAAYFIENWAAVLQAVTSDGVLPTMWTPTDHKIAQVATRDIGRVAAEALLAGPKGNIHAIELAGPEDLSSEDVAAVLSDLTGRDVTVNAVPPEAQVGMFTSFGASQGVAENFHEMYRGLESGRVAWEGGAAEFARGTTTARDVFVSILS